MNLSLDTNNFENTKIPKGTLIFSRDENAKSIYILKSGKVVCFLLTDDQRVIPVHGLKDNGIFGEDGVLSQDKAYKYSAVALEECWVTVIPKSAVDSVIGESADWMKNILNLVANRVHQTVEVLSDHKITDRRLNGGSELSSEEQKLILNSYN